MWIFTKLLHHFWWKNGNLVLGCFRFGPNGALAIPQTPRDRRLLSWNNKLPIFNHKIHGKVAIECKNLGKLGLNGWKNGPKHYKVKKDDSKRKNKSLKDCHKL